MKLQVVLAAFISLVLTSGAFAGERYLVVLKSTQSFKTASTTLSNKDKGFFNSFGFGNTFSKVNANVVDKLENLNTLVVSADAAEIAKLQNNSEVALIEKEIFHPAPKPMKGFVVNSKNKSVMASATAAPGKPWGIDAVKAPEAWKASGNKGSGTRVLVLDTGIDAEHPSLKANFEKGQDFTGASNGSDFSDNMGHGTHVSGTIAGIEDAAGFTGVAPEAKVLMGRVCSSAGCSNIAIAQGINWGVTENVDVISMSLGGMWSTPAERAAIDAADQAGITVVAASGNNGSGVVSYPAALPTVIAVGAINNKLEKADFSQFGPELAIVAPGVAVVSTVPMGSGRESEVYVTTKNVAKKVESKSFQGAKESSMAVDTELVYAGLGKPEDFVGRDFTGKYALISRGEITFGDKVKNALAAKAAGVIIYNNAPGLISGAITQDGTTLEIFAAMVEQTVGEELKAELDAGMPATASIMTLKTDYAAFDGTSMATPHVAGVVALVKGANKALKPTEVKAILQKTAQSLLGSNANNELGAGLVNAEAAVNAALGK
ncbi:S8 family serine peptidase [Bdellovibrio sp. HCB337]|uniref:S8 family serine peptidase n=1 Tax=Bdellovibrio sp. HCB337 TaxID=3394358 RepID=UPI0039A6C23D